MERRSLLQATSLGVGAAMLGALPERLRAAGEASSANVDVLVIGGGPAGSIAAIQAARAGAATMLIEMGSQLGGTTTTGGVATPSTSWGPTVRPRPRRRRRTSPAAPRCCGCYGSSGHCPAARRPSFGR